MKAYLWTTGTVFGLITLAHAWRVVAESPRLARDPTFVLITLLAAALCLWAGRLISVSARSRGAAGRVGAAGHIPSPGGTEP